MQTPTRSLTEECSRLLSRSKITLLNTPAIPAGQIETWIVQLQPDGTWRDINYADTNRGNWSPSYHLTRITNISRALVDPKNKFYQDTQARDAVFRGLDHWLGEAYQNANWWHNEIGTPQLLCRILVLAGDQLGVARKAAGLALYQRQYGRAEAGDGANTIWEAELGLKYGAFVDDESLTSANAALIAGEVTINGTAGIQDDFSFHQHGPRLQQFHYGGAYGADMARLSWELEDSRWAFTRDKIEILADYILKGSQWMTRGRHTVPGTLDRAISRPNALRTDLRQTSAYLAECLPQRATEFQDLIARENGQTPSLVGFRAFPRSDFTAYHRPQFGFFLKTISDRTLETESINSENLKGRQLSCGDHYLLSTGAEYDNLAPVWDWSLLPGVTADGNTLAKRKAFVGNIGNETSGLAAMDYCLASGTGTITARKIWAMHGDIIVCLIANLRTEGVQAPIRTALDQSRVNGPVTCAHGKNSPEKMAEGLHALSEVAWIHHGGFAYIPLRPASMTLRLGPVTGTWKSVNATQSDAIVHDRIFLPVLEHGSQPESQSVGYVLAGCPSPEKAAALVSHPTWQVLRNDASCQAIRFDGDTVMATFYQAGQLEENGRVLLDSNEPALIVQAQGNTWTCHPAVQV